MGGGGGGGGAGAAAWSSREAGPEAEEEKEEAEATAPQRRRLKEHASSPRRRTIRGSVAGATAFLSTALPPGKSHMDLDTIRCCGGRSSADMMGARRDERDEKETRSANGDKDAAMNRLLNGKTFVCTRAVVALCALWLAAGTAQAQILVSAEDTTHQVKSHRGRLGKSRTSGWRARRQRPRHDQFDADWIGSWRNDLNHDAAWIFFKVRPEGAKEWQHIRLAADRELNPTGYASEGNRKMDFLVPKGEDDYTGMFVRQAGQSSPCSIVLTHVTAVWDLSKSTGIMRLVIALKNGPIYNTKNIARMNIPSIILFFNSNLMLYGLINE